MSRSTFQPQDAHEEAAAWCLRLAEGPLSEEDRQRFDGWLGANPTHPVLFDAAVVVWRQAGEQADAPEMIVHRAAALEAARRANRRRWVRSILRSRTLLAVAAALIGAVVLVVWLSTGSSIYRTGIGERQVVTLRDGSRVSLDADTVVKVAYGRERRSLTLDQGRARFMVAKDPMRPFTVTADGQTVVAVGTDFSVERIAGQVRVILYEGKVSALAAPSGGGGPHPVHIGDRSVDEALKPGGAIVLSARGPAAARLEPVDPGRSLAWEGGQLIFDEEPLAQALARVNRYAARPVVVADAGAGEIRISGVFNAGDTDAFVEGVTAAFPLRMRTDSAGRVVLYNSSTAR
ncbi:FecR family protein [Brevundimonas diminuta]|uniref:FecR family protein n=1 Tax=Brevundimonas diminuta TaxID=293 RepID=UPI00198CB060|nr:FecR domain-containing protein [Brevundimonas diminuta]MBD3817391.1 FecR domain-containing protein [Brevundimonas diminuta]